MIKFIWYNIILSRILNWFIAPIAYLFRKYAQKRKKFLWWFLSDDNMYGDTNWRPNLKNKFLRAVAWMYRNPLQNYYWKDYIDGIESNFTGLIKVKFGEDIASWRTGICSDTGDWHGKILDFKSPLLGYQNIEFIRTDINGNIQKCFRKSRCIPFRFMFFWIMLWKWRRGHEGGLMQYSIAKPLFKYKDNKEGYKMWKEKEWYYYVKGI